MFVSIIHVLTLYVYYTNINFFLIEKKNMYNNKICMTLKTYTKSSNKISNCFKHSREAIKNFPC